MLLKQAQVRQLHAATIAAELARDVLLSGIDPRFVASLPLASSLAAQVLSDLNQLSRVTQLADGSVPLLTWLRNAVALAGPRREGVVFEAAYNQVTEALRLDGVRLVQPNAATEPRREGAVQVFLSVASKDARFADALEKHLSLLTRQGSIDLWRRTKIPLAANVREWVQEHIDGADLVVLMVTPDSVAGDETYAEIEQALALRETKGTRVVPVLVRAVSLESTSLSRLQFLPRSGVPIASSRDPDETYAEIASNLRAIVEDLRKQRKPTVGLETHLTGLTVDTLRGGESTAPGVRVGFAIRDIFVRNGVPDDTYVEPEQAAEIRGYLDDFDRGLVLEGPTQIGKTTAVTKLIGDSACMKLDAYSETAEAELAELMATDSIEGHILIENVHSLPDATLAKVARRMRLLADRRPSEAKITLVGISNVASRLARLQPDLAGRFERVEVNVQPPGKVRELVAQGERAANLVFEHSEEIVTAARGSFRLAQELCYQCAMVAKADRVVAGAPRRVSTLPDDARVRSATRNALDMVFEDPVGRFAEADREVDAPGACIALLWRLSIASDGRVLIRAAAERYSQLNAAFRWIQSGELAAWLRSPENADVAGLLTLVAGELRAPDPRFLYYLGLVDWKRLGALVGVEVLVPSESGGDLQIVHRPRAGPDAAVDVNGPASAARIAKGSLLDAPPPFPWWHPSASRFLSLMQAAYPNDDATVFLCSQVQGLGMGQVPLKVGMEPLWRAVIESAANQGKLRALVDVVLNDGSVSAYHGPIRDAVAPSAPHPAG